MSSSAISSRLRTRIGAVALTLASATAFLVSAAPGASAATSPKPGGSVTYGLEAETGGGWCPTSARLAISGIEVGAAIYDTLMVPNTKNEMVPYLAKSVEPNATFDSWVITLRDGIKFHDGTPLDSAALVRNFDEYRKSTLIGAALKPISTVTATGPLEVTVALSQPWPEFTWYLYLDGRFLIEAPAQLDSPDCASKLIGTGPFTLDHWTVNQELVANKNPDYWQKDSKGTQLPYLDKITFKPVAEAVQRINSLQGGQLDLIHTSDGQQVDALRNQLKGQFNVLDQGAGRSEVRYYLLNAAKAPLDDLNARKAIAMAIDRNQINQIRNNGAYRVADGPFDTKVIGYTKNPGFPQFNLKQAKKLASAYKAAHGGEFSVVIEHTNDPANTQEAEIIKEQLSKAGIDSTLKQDDQTAFIVAAVSGNFSILLWRQHPGDDPDAQYYWWNTGSTLNFGKFNDPTLQGLLDQGRTETDPAKRKQIYTDVNKRFASQVYNVWAYYADWVVGANKKVQGLTGPPLPDKGGNPAVLLYGRQPLLGLYVTK
ncbi:MAG TPA: ABC transporter substrate-binding protein [Acidimicrobiia bacterium]|jgi:peptide/nickel transport system substrate-binding protein